VLSCQALAASRADRMPWPGSDGSERTAARDFVARSWPEEVRRPPGPRWPWAFSASSRLLLDQAAQEMRQRLYPRERGRADELQPYE
jgi:hypothetical protein